MAYGDGGFRRGGGGGFRRGGGEGGGFRRSFGPREMHKIKCSACGKDAEVPFKPTGDRPVYCRECFFKNKGITPREPRSESEEPKKSEESEKTESEDLENTEDGEESEETESE
ncbi:MAG TPA: CxxC-x17-CxxC domain-containing protein [Candidatus Nanoarchaeia archaeon]|nr:CxxC-x17-CxxC domain-containing protein [Candidatus Nanoarchaeia archaeon]